MKRIYARDTIVEIDLDAIAQNVVAFRRHLGNKAKILATVKGDAYGHGAIHVAKAALEAGAEGLCVSFIDEAIELRKAGIKAPILVFSYTPTDVLELALQYRLMLTVYSEDTLTALQHLVRSSGQSIKIHVKVDTGMGRLGLQPQEVLPFVQKAMSEPLLEVDGLYTHFSTADEGDKAYTNRQVQAFQRVIDELAAAGIHLPCIHAANSAAAIDLPEYAFDMIRLGISLYGLYPSVEVNHQAVALQPALSLKSRVIRCEKPPAGTGISYGRLFTTTGNETIATVPVGYADGFSRRLSERGFALVHGKRVPIVGRVCMDHIMLDVSAIPDVAVGEEVVLYGRQGEECISVNEVATLLGTISHEVVCMLNHRVPRVYLRQGKPVATVNRLRQT